MVCLSAACAWMCATSASAQALPTVDLTWQAPVGCASHDTVIDEVTALLGEKHAAQHRVQAVVRVSARDASLFDVSVSLRSDGAEDTRALVAESCVAASKAAALLIALAVDPTAMLGSNQPPPAASSPLAPTPPEAPPDTAAIHLDLGAGIAFESGTLPGAATGPSLRLQVAWRALRVGLLAGYAFAKTARSPVRASDSRAEIDAVSLGVFSCYLPDGLGFSLGPCLAARSARLAATPSDVRMGNEADGRIDSLFAAIAAEFHVGTRLLLRPEAGMHANLRRPRFVVAGAGTLHQPARLGASAELQLIVRF